MWMNSSQRKEQNATKIFWGVLRFRGSLLSAFQNWPPFKIFITFFFPWGTPMIRSPVQFLFMVGLFFFFFPPPFLSLSLFSSIQWKFSGFAIQHFKLYWVKKLNHEWVGFWLEIFSIVGFTVMWLLQNHHYILINKKKLRGHIWFTPNNVVNYISSSPLGGGWGSRACFFSIFFHLKKKKNFFLLTIIIFWGGGKEGGEGGVFSLNVKLFFFFSFFFSLN